MNDSLKKTILLVDDEALLVLSLKSILEREGYRVQTAFTGDEALKTVREDPGIDLVLMDIDLGSGMDGIITAGRMQEQGDVPVLFLSAYMDREISSRINNVQACGYVVKNSSDEVLFTSIQQAIKLHEVRRDLVVQRTRYQTLLESIADMVFVVDRDLRLTMVNEAVVRYTALQRESLTGKKITEILPGLMDSPLLPALQRVTDSGVPEVVSLVIALQDGREEWLDMTATKVPEGLLLITRIVTETKQFEMSLRNSEERWRSLTQHSPDHIVLLDTDLNIQFVNRPSPGLNFGDLIGKSILGFLSESDRERVREKLQNVLLQQEMAVYETEYEISEGLRIYYETRAVPLIYGDVVEGILFTSRDITERKNIQMELERHARMQECLYSLSRLIVNDSPIDEIYEKSIDEMQKTSGLPMAVLELLNDKGDALIFTAYRGLPADLPESFSVAIDETVSGIAVKTGKTVIEEDISAFREYGNSILSGLEVRCFICVPLVVGDRIIGVISLADREKKKPDDHIIHFVEQVAQQLALVISRKTALDSLKKSENLLQKVFDTLPVGLWIADEKGEVRKSNPAGRRIWGGGYLAGQDKYGLFKARRLPSGEEIAPEDWALAHTVNEGVTITDEMLEIEALDGEKRIILNYTAPVLDEQGRIEAAIVVNQDITELKRNEAEKEEIHRQLTQAQKMEAIGTLAGGLAHDFNNVLGAMRGSLDIVQTYLADEDLKQGEKILKYIETAQRSTRRATDIIRQLLTLSRRDERNMMPLDVNSSLEHVYSIAKNSFPKSVSLDFKAGEKNTFIIADQTQIEQALLNICVNASHAMTIMRGEDEREGGTLTVEALKIRADSGLSAVYPEVKEGMELVMIKVSDNGVGMDEETRKHIFEPFYTTKEKSSGTGLGLSMTYSIIKSHGGFIDVKSRPGEGCAFHIYLPAMDRDVSRNTGEPRSEGECVRGSGSILVIDDEHAILDVAREFLTQCGYFVTTADDPEKGIACYRERARDFDAVLLDLSMPVMSGYDVYRELRNINRDVRVLLTSGFANDDRVEKILAAGARGFVSKPFSKRNLSLKMSQVLKGPPG